MTAVVSLDGLLLNGRLFQTPELPSEYSAVLKSSARIVDPSPPAPYGHRNNQIHLFDELGLYLIEHHATRLIGAVVFVLWMEEAAFQITREYVGELFVGGVRVYPGMIPREFIEGTIAFDGPVHGQWKAEKDGIWIGLHAKKLRLGSGRRGKQLRFTSVDVCFDD